MTAQRQERYGSRPGIALFALLASFFGALSLDSAASAATTERVVVNRYSGLAIEGFDPVAYFTESVAAQGSVAFEAPRFDNFLGMIRLSRDQHPCREMDLSLQ